MRTRLLERFLRYVSYDTTSDSGSTTYPSTQSQRLFMDMLASELIEIGCTDVVVDSNGYLTATVEGNVEGGYTIGFLAHVDTSPDMCGSGIEVQVIEDYDPLEPIRLGDTEYVLSSAEFEELHLFKGHTLLTTKGRTLLGADDKAGVAEIVTAVEYLISHAEIKHGRVRVGFTPDEEIGRGVDYFDVESFGADFAYTVDSGAEGCLEYENFNAASVVLNAEGRNFHPGYAKGRMVSAIEKLVFIHSELSESEKPQTTSGREGFVHLISLSGGVESARSEYIVRDFEVDGLASKCQRLRELAIDQGVSIEIAEQYRNMREIMEGGNMYVVDLAEVAMRRAGVAPHIHAIRGGTDGARLSFMGLPCPNIFTGGMNFHSRFEYASLCSMERAVRTIVNIATNQNFG